MKLRLGTPSANGITRRDVLAGVSLLVARGIVWPADVVRTSPASPVEILLLRHAEKPEPRSDVHLSERGRARAEALVRLFPARFQAPMFLFAARASNVSNHAAETLEPLAEHLHLTIDTRFADARYGRLANALMQPAYVGSHVLVCWHHETLPQLARALGATGAPSKWRDSVFDRIWQLRYDAGAVSFMEFDQGLLPGDRH